jgi:hypothetical protein
MSLDSYSTEDLETELRKRELPKIRPDWCHYTKDKLNIREAAERFIKVVAEHSAAEVRSNYERHIVVEVLVAIYGESVMEWVKSHTDSP